MQKTGLLKSKKKIILLLVICLIALTAITVMLAVLAMQGKDVWIVQKVAGFFAPEPEVIKVGPVEGWTPAEKTPRPVSFERPDDMRAIYIRPGEDFYITGSESMSELMAQIDSALDLAVTNDMNAVVVDPMLGNKVIHPSSTFFEATLPTDAMGYIVEACHARGLYVYSIYYVLPNEMAGRIDTQGQVDTDLINRVRESADVFARQYELNGVMLDNYFLMDKADRYEGYLLSGAGIGYDHYMYDLSDTLFGDVVDTFNQVAPNIQVGVISEAVWANQTENEVGSATKSNFTMLGTGHCDVKSYIEQGRMDFVAVRAYDSTVNTAVPYASVISWWAGICGDNDLPLYMIHAAHKAGTQELGWDQYDQLPKQIIEARKHTGFSGSIFNSLTWLREDPVESASKLMEYYAGNIREDSILAELGLTKPAQRTYNTYEPVATFAGASDPNVKLTLNGEPIEIDENGFFSLTVDLDPGLNTFAFYNKGKTITYNITRIIKVIADDSYGPLGTIEVDGGTEITIATMAYNGSTVYAVVSGTRVDLTPVTEQDDSTVTDSDYQRYSGTYTAPAATDKEQNLGNIVLYGSWRWKDIVFPEEYKMAVVKVNKKAELGGRPIIVTADVAETFPTSTINDISNSSYYPIPRGAIDYAVGNEIIYSDGAKTFSYYNLASGVRVYSKDISLLTTGEEPGGNRISGYTVSANSRYTTVTIEMSQQVSYSAKYERDAFTIKFNYTTSVPSGMSLNQNPLFDQASWNGVTLRLDLQKRSVFMGYKAWYNGDGDLVLQFNNPPRVSGSDLSGVVIVVDPGHGGSDPGATGFLRDYPEKAVNYLMSAALTSELRARGATVHMLDTYGNNVTLESRVRQARNIDPHLYISMHANSAVRSSASGAEVYYFNDYSYGLAYYLAPNIAGAMGNANRGVKSGLYYVTRDSQFPSVLCEIGFMSNQSDYYKLISADYQNAVAYGIANGVSSYLQSIATASTATGTESSGG